MLYGITEELRQDGTVARLPCRIVRELGTHMFMVRMIREGKTASFACKREVRGVYKSFQEAVRSA
jgi:hypothetical protein